MFLKVHRSGKKETAFPHDLGDVQGRSSTQPSPQGRTAGNQRSCIHRDAFSLHVVPFYLSETIYFWFFPQLCVLLLPPRQTSDGAQYP